VEEYQIAKPNKPNVFVTAKLSKKVYDQRETLGNQANYNLSV